MPPLELTLEFARTEAAGEEYAFRFQAQTYNVRWENGTYAEAELTWNAALLADLVALQRPRPDPALRQRLGELLRTFLGEAGWQAREAEIAQAVKSGRTLHLTIRSAAAELYALPWELLTLRATGEHIGELPCCLLRYEWPGTETATPAPDPPAEGGRLLFAWSAAGGAVPAAEHLDAIRRAAVEGHHPFDEDRDVIARVSTSSLRAALAGSPVAVLHVLCHGGRLPSGTETYGLTWDAEEPSGAPERIDAAKLRKLLKPHLGTLRLVVLMACHGASVGEPANALGAVAQALHRIGIPAVVASRQPLSVPGSIALTQVFYEGLLKHLTALEDAFLHAREKLAEDTASGDWASLQLYARAADGPDHRPFVVRPYRGLLAFHEEHARCFFGRQPEIDEAVSNLSKLIEATAAGKPRFLLVTGASGTGKSSLVFAGVVPAMQAKDEGRWRVVPMRPRNGLSAIEAALASQDKAKLLFIVDQFEEIFTDLADQAARVALAQRLWALAGDPASGVSVIVTLRIDFLGRCGEIRLDEAELDLEEVAYDEAHRVFARRMKRERLREIIELPSARVGLGLDAGLVEQALKDAGDEPGALPLVEYTLDQLWHVRAPRGARYRLTWDAYTALGGVTGALAKKADAVLAGLDEVRQRAARRLLVQLVDTREDALLDTRRRVRKDKLRPGPEMTAGVFDEVLDTLARERLVVVSEEEGKAKAPPIVEIAHEQIVRSWETLRGWLNEDRQRLLEMEPLKAWMEAAKGSPGYVLQGDQLARANALVRKYGSELDTAERGLIERSRFWARVWRVGAGAVGVILVMITLVAVKQWRAATKAESQATDAATKEAAAAQDAKEQAAKARAAARMAGSRELFAHGDATSASRVLLEVADPEGTPGWLGLAYEILNAGGFRKAVLRGHEARVNSASFSADGQRVVTASEDNTARVWNVADGSQLALLKGHEARVNSAVFSADGQRVVTASSDTAARVWNATDGSQLARLKGHEDSVVSAAFSPDGQRVVTASWDKTARVWNAADGSQLALLKGHEDAVYSAAFSADGQRVVTASEDNTARVWNAADGKQLALLKGHENPVSSAAFSADGQRVVTASDAAARVWSAADGKQLAVLKGHENGVDSAAFSADGQRVVTASWDKTARVWNAADGSQLALLKGHEDSVMSAAFSADGQRVVTASWDKTARVWNAADGSQLALFNGHEDVVKSAAFSADGQRVVTASWDKTARMWNAADGNQLALLKGHEDRVISAAFSADGQRVVTASNDNTARVWNAADGRQLALLKGQDGVISAAFSADGQRVVTASEDNTTVGAPRPPRLRVAYAGSTQGGMENQQTRQSAILHNNQEKLEGYFGHIGTILGYSERKASFAMYAMGLLSEGERKSAEPIAARAAGGDPALCKKYHDRLCHFLHGSQWDDIAVRQYAATFALKELTKHEPIEVTIIDDTGFLKQGDQSPGVQRQYTGSAGKIANCQVAVSLVLATRTQHLPIDMDLFLPECWTEDPVRMNKAHVPIDVGFRPKWQIALDMVERAMGADIPLGVVSADAWYGSIPAFRGGLAALGLLYTVDINATTQVTRLSDGGEEIGSALSVLHLALTLPVSEYRTVTWRQGTQKKLSSRFARIRVCAQGRDDCGSKEQTLLIEWPDGETEPTHYVLSTLPKRTTLHELVRLTKQRWRTERAYEDMKGELGLDHFEGRTYPGWQHHISVVLVCYAFVLAVLRRSFPPSARGTGAARTFEDSPRAALRRLVYQRTAQYRACAGRLAASMPRLPPTCHAYVRTTR